MRYLGLRHARSPGKKRRLAVGKPCGADGNAVPVVHQELVLFDLSRVREIQQKALVAAQESGIELGGQLVFTSEQYSFINFFTALEAIFFAVPRHPAWITAPIFKTSS